MSAPIYPLPPLSNGMFRVMYIFDIRETYLQLLDRCQAFINRFVPESAPTTPEELVRAWFEYHLIRNHYLEIPRNQSPWLTNSVFHNNVLIACHYQEQMLHRKLSSVALEHQQCRATCSITHRDLVLTFDLRH